MPAFVRRAPKRVIPVRSQAGVRTLTASASRVNLNDRKSIRRFVSTRQGWQEEAWMYRREIGELRYATAYLGNSAMRMRLFPAAYLPGGAVPQDATQVPGIPPDLMQAAKDTIARLASGGPFALGQLLKKQTENFEVAGECYLVGTVDAFGLENWNVYSTSEMVFDVGGRLGIRLIPGNGMSAEDIMWLSPQSSYVTRLWWPDPQYGAMADSPVRAALGLCYELQLLSLDVRATAKSRLANNGILMVPEGLSIIPINPADESTIEGDPFLKTLVDAATSALSDEGSAAAVLPLVIRGAADALKELRHMPLDRAADKQNADKRKELLSRLATTLDLPSEILTGIADLNHWSAWQVDDNAFRHHIEPVVQVQIDALTAGFLWPMLAAYKRWPPEMVRRICIWYDPTELVTHPDRATDAKTAFDSGAIGRAALREYLGMTPLDKPDDLDEILHVLKNAGHVDPVLLTAILKSLKQTSITIPEANQLQSAQVAQSQEQSAQARADAAHSRLVPGNGPAALPPGGATGGETGPDVTPSPDTTPATIGPPDDMMRRVGNAKTAMKLRKAITAAADPQAPIAEATPTPPGQEPEHSGAMVALYPDEQSANDIALDDPDGEPANDLHVTMVYIPDFDPANLPALQQAVDQFAASQQPLEGKLGGKGQFNPSESSDGKPVTYGSVDCPGLSEMRTDLVRHLQDSGHQIADNHGFTPHMTLAYGEKPDLDVQDKPLQFGHLSVVHGDDRQHYPLGTAPTPEQLAAAAVDYSRDSAKLAQLDRDLRARLQMAANSAMRRAFERAGAKVVSKSKTPAGKRLALAASISGIPTWQIPIQIGPSLLAALGVSDLINDETLSELREAYDKYIETGQDQALRLAARIAGVDINTAFGLKDQLRAHQESGWDFLVQSMRLRAQQLVERLGDDQTRLTVDTDLVPYGQVRATIAVAGGQPPGLFDTATGLPVEPGVATGGVGNGIVVSDLIEGAGGHVERYIWHHGWAANPFDPHVRLDGTTFADFSDEKFRAEPLASGADFPHGGFYHPGDHPGCFEAGTLVSAGGVQVTFERAYTGDLVDVTMASGQHLRCTPNHPILTPHGWVAAGKLDHGSEVIGCLFPDRMAQRIDLDNHYGQTPIEQIAQSFGAVTSVVPTVPANFHGDGIDKEICVIRADSDLWNGEVTSDAHPLGKDTLAIGTELAVKLAREGGLPEAASGAGADRTGWVSNDVEAHSDHLTAAVHLFGNSLIRVTSQEQFDQLAGTDVGSMDAGAGFYLDRVISVTTERFDGQVYNLQTETGWYLANHIVSSNCTCDFEVVWSRQELPATMVAGAWEETKHPRNRGKFARKAGPGEAAKLSEALGKRQSEPELDLASDRRPDGHRWGEGYDDPRDPRNDPGYDRRTADLNQRIDETLGTVGDTENIYDKIDGAANVYNPHREALHEKIINRHLDRFAKIPRDRRAIMLAGPPGAGKTTVLQNNGQEFGVEGFKSGQHGPESSNFAILNADDMKADLLAEGEYPSGYSDAGIAPNESSQFLHEESSYLMKELQTRLRFQGTNMIIDGTFGGDDVRQRDKALGFQADGYQVTGVLVDGDIGTALEGAGKRHQKGGTFKGRYVPYKLITDQAPRRGGPKVSPLTGHPYRSANAQNFDFALDAFGGGAHVFDRHDSATIRTAHVAPR